MTINLGKDRTVKMGFWEVTKIAGAVATICMSAVKIAEIVSKKKQR